MIKIFDNEHWVNFKPLKPVSIVMTQKRHLLNKNLMYYGTSVFNEVHVKNVTRPFFLLKEKYRIDIRKSCSLFTVFFYYSHYYTFSPYRRCGCIHEILLNWSWLFFISICIAIWNKFLFALLSVLRSWENKTWLTAVTKLWNSNGFEFWYCQPVIGNLHKN